MLHKQDYLKMIHELKQSGVKIKVNTVISKENCHEDFHEIYGSSNVDRIKVMKRIIVSGENEDAEDMIISDADFQRFIEYHQDCENLVYEKETDIRNTYVMISPDGRLFSSCFGEYTYSSSLLDLNFRDAMSSVPFDVERFLLRGGDYFS